MTKPMPTFFPFFRLVLRAGALARLFAACALLFSLVAMGAKTIPTQLPRPDENPPATDKPVKVYRA